MSTAEKPGLGARLLKAARGEDEIEISGCKIIIKQMSAAVQMFLATEVRSLLDEVEGPGKGSDDVNIDMSKVDIGLLSKIAFECCYDENGSLAFESPEQAAQLPMEPLGEIVAKVVALSKSTDEDGNDDTKGGSTEGETS